MPYPSRGTWSFYNQTRDYDFWVALDSLTISQTQPGAVAIFAGRVTDLDSSFVMDNEDIIIAKFDGERIFAGHVKTLGRTWTNEAGIGPRTFDIEAQDFTAKLDDALIRRRSDRKFESARRRAKWILKFMSRIYPMDWDISGIPATRNVPKANYYGSSVNDALQQLADDVRLHYYVDFDPDEDGVPTVHVFRDETIQSPIDFDNDSPDFATSFPFREFLHETDSVELATAVLVEPEKPKHARWRTSPSSIAAYGRQERFISDVQLKNAQAAKNVGDQALAEYDTPLISGSFMAHEPGIYAGMTFSLTEALHEIEDETFIVQSVDLQASDPHDDDDTAYMRTFVTFTDRRRRRKVGKVPSNKNAKDRKDVTDTHYHDLDGFDRIVAPPALSDGASPGSFVVAGTANEGRWWDIGAWVFEPEQDDVTPIESGFYFTAGRVEGAVSGVGDWQSWTSAPRWGGCESVSWTGIGFGEREMWWKLPIPAHPANAAGITFTIETDPGSGYATVAGAEVVVLDAQPTALRQGTVVQQLGGSTEVDISVPIALVPAEGGELWVGLRTAFETTFKAEVYDWFCGTPPSSGWQSYHVTGHGFPYCGYSGSIGFLQAPNTPLWQVWGATEPVLGAIADGGKAPWEGGNTVYDGGYTGSGDAWSMTGSGFNVTAEETSSKTIYVVGEREDTGETDGPWSDASWGIELSFFMDAVGDTGVAGTREIRVVTSGDGEGWSGVIHLGDADNDPGIRVNGPAATDYEAVTLTAGDLWRAKFDSRSGLYIRGKVWKASDGEPALWNVSAALNETEDDQDRYAITISAGNGVGDSQSVSLTKTRAAQGSPQGFRIVKEWIGYADGLTKRFYTTHPFVEESLRVAVNGHTLKPTKMEGEESEFTTDFWPTDRSRLYATYTVA